MTNFLNVCLLNGESTLIITASIVFISTLCWPRKRLRRMSSFYEL